MNVYRLCVLGVAFFACAAFSTDRAGRLCVERNGQRGVAYDVDRTTMTDAYSPNGRRLIQNGHRVYTVVVPPLTKRDKPITCTMSLADELWNLPKKNPFAPEREADPLTARETPGLGFR